MKATGIVRRIDDLGRVVIPKEIRRTLHIREGDPLEIYTEKDGEVIFKKYSRRVICKISPCRCVTPLEKIRGISPPFQTATASLPWPVRHGGSFWTSPTRQIWI